MSGIGELMLACRAWRIKQSKQTTGTEKPSDHQEAAARGLVMAGAPPLGCQPPGSISITGLSMGNMGQEENITAPEARKC